MTREQKLQLRKWMIWIALNVVILSYFGYAFVAPASTVKSSLLPGETTHGHYQIELNCAACHESVSDESQHTSDNVMQDACIRCHGDQLKAENDTHPAKKFNDPANADLLATLDAQNCLTCHQEHVPEQTSSMGVSLPTDYCWHCHQDVGDSRPSHVGMKFDSCATAGCHNYHDNRAIYEKFLDDHYGEPDFLDAALLPKRNLMERWKSSHEELASLSAADADAPAEYNGDPQIQDPGILADWAETAHAAAGVNCRGCHAAGSGDDTTVWSDQVSMTTCQACHGDQVETFMQGKHGMRLASGMTPMTTAMARLPMHTTSMHTGGAHHTGDAHRELTCNACHSGHRFDTDYAAVTACQSCHADSHSLAYSDSSHASLWQRELAGEMPEGSGVTCATCHLPRITGTDDDGQAVWVNHDQNAVLRPNETMARQVCSHCHGLDFSLSSLADHELMLRCYDGPPGVRTKSVEMAHAYFEERREKRRLREAKRNAKTQ